jgi:hypothetical protein
MTIHTAPTSEIAQSQVFSLLIHGWLCTLLETMSWLLIQIPKSYASPWTKQKLVKLPEFPFHSCLSIRKAPASVLLLASAHDDNDVRPCSVGHPRGLKPSVFWLTDTKSFILFPVVPGPLPLSLTIRLCSPGLQLLIDTHSETRLRKGSYFPTPLAQNKNNPIRSPLHPWTLTSITWRAHSPQTIPTCPCH